MQKGGKFMKEYTLDVGLFAPTIKEQLDAQEVYMKETDYDTYEKFRSAIHILGVHISTESETRKNWERFYKKIEKDIFDERVI